MKALEILKNQEILLPEELQSKKIKPFTKMFNTLLSEMDKKVREFAEFKDNQTEGELASKIIIAKSLANFFANNKILRVDLVAESYRNQEKAKLAEFYNTKNRLLETLHTILRESQKEAVISAFDIFKGDFQKCENGHEIIILKDRNISVLETFINELDEYVVVNGNYDSLEAQEVDFNTEVLDRNIDLCTRKNNELYGSKSSKFNKFEAIIRKLHEVGKQVVAFYTYKETLIEIGCNPKNIKLYENELSKAYVPMKKLLQKEFSIELEDICEIVVNEEEYAEEVEVDAPNTWETEQQGLSEDIVYHQPVVKDLLADTESVDSSEIHPEFAPVNTTEETIATTFSETSTTSNYTTPSVDLFETNNTFNTPTTTFETMSDATPSEIFASETFVTPTTEVTSTEDTTTSYDNTFIGDELSKADAFEQPQTPSYPQADETTSTYSTPFETTPPITPMFEENYTTTTKPFETTSTPTNIFDNNVPVNNNPFENTTNNLFGETPTTQPHNMFEEETPKRNPFTTTNMFED